MQLGEKMKIMSLWGNPFKKTGSDIASEVDFISTVPVFDTLSKSQIAKIYKLIHVRHYNDGEIVYRQGDPGVGMFIIFEGSVDIYNEYPDLTREKKAELKKGDFFGEISLLNDSPRSATIICSKNSILFGLFRPNLLDLMDSDPKLGLRFIYRLSQIVAERFRLSLLETSE